MSALTRLITFTGVVSTGGFLLVALANPVPQSETKPAATPVVEKAQADSDRAALAESNAPVTTEEAATTSTPAVVEEHTPVQKTVKRTNNRRSHDGKEFKEFKELLPPIGEGPADTGAPELPAGVESPQYPVILNATP